MNRRSTARPTFAFNKSEALNTSLVLGRVFLWLYTDQSYPVSGQSYDCPGDKNDTLTTAKHYHVHLSRDMLYACFIDWHYSERNIRSLITTDVYGPHLPYGQQSTVLGNALQKYEKHINSASADEFFQKRNNTCSRIRQLYSPVMTRVYTC